MSGKRTHLVIIDPQNSFCKVVEPAKQQVLHDGELCVPGGWDDMVRTARLLDRIGDTIHDIHVTLDSHHLLDIAHPTWFRDADGRPPEPFTIMQEQAGRIVGGKSDDRGESGESREYWTSRGEFFDRTVDYLRRLAAAGRYPHSVWPPHCIIGTPGQGIVQPLIEPLLEWCRRKVRFLDIRPKGNNPFVEHFSAVHAEVPDPDDPSTWSDPGLIKKLVECDEILLTGEAGSHCLANTIRDLIAVTADDGFLKRCVLLTDATSPVPGFETYQRDFVHQMIPRGLRTTTCAEYVA